jgi:hypothetical protein
LGVLCLTIACGSEPAGPEQTAREFAEALRASQVDVQAVLDRLDQRSLDHLQRAAERASDQIGGRRAIEPDELFEVVGMDHRSMEIREIELIETDGATARVKLISADGSEHVLDLVLQEDAWRVRVPVPDSTEAPQ